MNQLLDWCKIVEEVIFCFVFVHKQTKTKNRLELMIKMNSNDGRKKNALEEFMKQQ